jgi:hypothetical protein
MEKKGARLFQQETGSHVYGWNIMELESRRQLHQKVNELIGLSYNYTLTTNEMRERLLLGVATFGKSFATQLVRSLRCDDQLKRQHIVWLLTLLEDKEIIPLLQRLAHNERESRSVRLSASLALAGMGATAETIDDQPCVRLYAIG